LITQISIWFLFEIKQKKKKRKKKERKKRRKDNWITLLGFEESQTIPVWPHKSSVRFQFKLPFDVKLL